MVSEEQLQATGLSERYLATYRLTHASDPPLSLEAVSEQVGVTPETVKRHLAVVSKRVEDPTALRNTETGKPDLAKTNPEQYAAAVNKLSDRKRNITAVAREVGVSPSTASKIAKSLDGDMMPLQRAIEDVRLEDLTKRFGTLARDAIDAITPEKLEKANAQQLSLAAAVAVDKWQLLRGQPTQRMEIGDRRKMNEILELVVKEAKRRQIEIDVTPEGGVTAKKSPFRNAAHKREMKRLQSGDPVETLEPA